MLVPLLLYMLQTQASCEWVEISQQHYLKPARTTRVYPQIPVIKDVERTTNQNRPYVNNSLTNPNWSKGAIYKVPNSEVKSLIHSAPLRSKPINFEDDEIEIDRRKIYVDPTKSISEFSMKPPEENRKHTERVYYNKDNVKRITFTSTEESLKPLEVLNLSDLDYDEDEFPTIEVDDGKFSVEQFEHTKHVTAVITTEDEEDRSDNLSNNVQSLNKIHARQPFITKTPPKKDIKVEKTPAGQNSSKSSLKHNNGHSKPVNNLDTSNLDKVLTLKEKSSSMSHSPKSEKNQQEDRKNSVKNSSISDSAFQGHKYVKNSGNSKMSNSNKLNQMLDSSKKSLNKVIQEKPRLEKNVLRIDELPKRFKIRNPEEVMLEEILHDSDDSFEDLKQNTSNIGSVKKMSNKSTITKVNIPKINEFENKNSSFKTLEPHMQMPKNKYTGTVDKIKTDNHDQKNVIKETAIVTAGSKIKENKEFESIQLTEPTPLPVITENLFEPNESNNHKEGRPDIATTKENSFNDEQEKPDEFMQPVTSNQEETKIKVKPPLTETTTTVKVEFSTKAPPLEKTITASDEKVESGKLDSKKPPAVKKVDPEHGTQPLANDTTTDILGTLVKVLKLVTDTISRNTRKTIRGKMQYLEELRDTIMASIEQRLEAVFPDDDDAPRRARSARAHGRGHVEFPSSESALMTISFLTFAVFLIKLVLQVIQAYKQKAMVMPAVVATVGRAYRHYSRMKAGE